MFDSSFVKWRFSLTYWDIKDAVIRRTGGDTLNKLDTEWRKLRNQLMEKLVAKQWPVDAISEYISRYKQSRFSVLVRLDSMVSRVRENYKAQHQDVARAVRLWYS